MKKLAESIRVEVSPTKEDKELVQKLAEGMTGQELADAMDLNVNNLAFMLSNLRVKFGCKNTLSLVVLFLRNKFIE